MLKKAFRVCFYLIELYEVKMVDMELLQYIAVLNYQNLHNMISSKSIYLQEIW